jgi:hypothetical protein
MGAIALRPLTSPSQKAPTPTPSGETTPHPVMTAVRAGRDKPAEYRREAGGER